MIYLDYAATTPVDPAVLRAMRPYFTERFGNPGSLHSFGQSAIAALDTSRETIARSIGAQFRDIIFTSSATEANNLALRGVVRRALSKSKIENPRVVVSTIEHESVLETARALEREGVEIIFVDPEPAKIKEAFNERTILVSVMYANNETGSVQPIAEIASAIRQFRESHAARVAHAKNPYPLFHTDAAQAFQFLDCRVATLGVDLMTLSSHKIYGPKGAGALYVADHKFLDPIISGGGQEYKLRSGTENVPAIVGFAKAIELAGHVRAKESKRIASLRNDLWRGIRKVVPAAEINGGQGADGANTLPHILNIYFPGQAAQALLTKFDLNGLAVSSGSACRSRAMESSYVIEALGYSKERAKSSIRFSLGRPTTKGEIAATVKLFSQKFRTV